MGRKTDMHRDNNGEQNSSTTVLSCMASNSMPAESHLHRDIDEHHQLDDHDLLIHDTILPHRKRIRKDTLLSMSQQCLQAEHEQSSLMINACKLLDVSSLPPSMIQHTEPIEISLAKKARERDRMQMKYR